MHPTQISDYARDPNSDAVQYLQAKIERETQLDIIVTHHWDDYVEPPVSMGWEATATGYDTNKPTATGYSSTRVDAWGVGPFDALDKLAAKLGVELERESITSDASEETA